MTKHVDEITFADKMMIISALGHMIACMPYPGLDELTKKLIRMWK